MTELQPIDKWLLEEAYDKTGHTGKLTIDYLFSHLSSRKNLKASIDQFTGTLYQITDALNQRFRDLKCPIRAYADSPNYILFTLHKPKARTIIRRIKIPISPEEKRLSEQEKNEYIAFLHQAIAARREEQEKFNAIRTKKISKNVENRFPVTKPPTKADTEKAIKTRIAERNLIIDG